MCSKQLNDADEDIRVAQNLVKIITSGIEAQNERTRTLLMALKKTAAGNAVRSGLNKKKVTDYCNMFDLSSKNKSLEELAADLAEKMMGDMDRTSPDVNATLEATAPPERKMVWDNLDISPAGTTYELSRAHDDIAAQGDLRQVMDTIARLGITYFMNSVGCASIAQDCLYGSPQRVKAKANPEVLQSNAVSIVVSIEDLQIAKELAATAHSEEYAKQARQAGAEEIRVYAVGASNPSAIEPLVGVIPLSHVQLSGLIIATGAIDLWLTDPHGFSPELLEFANANKTVVVTTEPSDRVLGTESIDLGDTEKESTWAGTIVTKAIENFKNRSEINRRIPSKEIEAVAGFNLDSLEDRYGCMSPVASALINGQIKGIVNVTAGRNANPHFETDLAAMADILLSNDILVFVNGYAAFALMAQGYCSTNALDKCGTKLQKFLGGSLPPVWSFSSSLNSLHVMLVFREIAKYAGHPIKNLPFAELSPNWSDEQDYCLALAYRMLGFNSYHCDPGPVQEARKIQEMFSGEAGKSLGSSMTVIPDPEELARKIVRDFDEARSNVCWR